MIRLMNIAQALEWALKSLQPLNTPRLEAEVLLAVVLEKDRAFLKAHGAFALTEDQVSLYKNFVRKRANNVPVAYIVGFQDWHDMRLLVNPSVLIPRDETEVLVRYIIKEQIAQTKNPISILDIGTGSGAIVVALGRACQTSNIKYQISGVDISLEALEVARANAQKYGVNVDFVQSDLLLGVDERSWDIIVANLPYVPEDLEVSLEVQKEPRLALFSGRDGLDHYRRLSQQLMSRGVVFGQLWIEFLPTQQKALEGIFEGFSLEWRTDVGSEVYFACITSDLRDSHIPG